MPHLHELVGLQDVHPSTASALPVDEYVEPTTHDGGRLQAASTVIVQVVSMPNWHALQVSQGIFPEPENVFPTTHGGAAATSIVTSNGDDVL